MQPKRTSFDHPSPHLLTRRSRFLLPHSIDLCRGSLGERSEGRNDGGDRGPARGECPAARQRPGRARDTPLAEGEQRDGEAELQVQGHLHPPVRRRPRRSGQRGGDLPDHEPRDGRSFTFDLPKTHWSTTPAGTLFKYRDSALAESGKVTIALAGGRSLKVSGRRTGISLNETSQGALVTVLTLGSFRYCARFDDGAVSRDQPGAFSAKNAPPPASCPSLPTTTTTTSTTTSLTLPPMTLPALGHLSFTISPGTT